MERLSPVPKALHRWLLGHAEGVLRRARRITPLRRLYVRLVDPQRYALFALERWVRKGLDLRARNCIDGICIELDGAWIRTTAGLEIGFMTDLPGGGLDADLYAGRATPALNGIISGLLPPDSIMVDVGANVGWVALNAALTSRVARIYAFEPGEYAYGQLRANIERNGMDDRITPINKAVADLATTMQFTNDPLTHSLNHLQRLGASSASAPTVSIETVTLDDFVHQERLDRLDVVKCDVEGAELLVLQGAKDTIERFRPTFVLEVEAIWLERFDASPKDVVDFLVSRGYECRVDRALGETNWIFVP